MAKSIIQEEHQCYMCGRNGWLEEHHCFGAANRKNSEKYGLKVYLCHWCHNEPPDGIHHNKDNRLKLQQIAQGAFIKNYPDLDFISIFGKNYL